MHILAADGLTCPRCGPEFPLILLANEVRQRRVLDGTLGCANCREGYPVRAGFGDLRPEPRRDDGPHAELPVPDEDAVDRAGALLDVSEGSRAVLVGRAARFAAGLAERLPDIGFWAISPAMEAVEERDGVERMRVAGRLPFGDWSIRGVLVEGDDAPETISEAIRVLAPGHRVVILDPPAGLRDLLLARGLKVATPADGVLLGARGGTA